MGRPRAGQFRAAAEPIEAEFRVCLYRGTLASVSDAAVLAGANAAALVQPDGSAEIVQFAYAELVGERTYQISRLLRGQAGSDAVVMLAAIDRDLSAPPASPAEGARYLVKAPGSGAFAGKDNQVAHYLDGGWSFYAPVKGWTCYVGDEAKLVTWDGTSWQGVGGAIAELQNLGLLGLGTTADTTNPFAAKLNNAVWAARSVAEGGDGNLRDKLSKESAAKTLSLLFQDNYSGRAEIGLTGDDDFHFKTSPDGSNWIDALSLDKATGAAKINAAFLLAGNICRPKRLQSNRVVGGERAATVERCGAQDHWPGRRRRRPSRRVRKRRRERHHDRKRSRPDAAAGAKRRHLTAGGAFRQSGYPGQQYRMGAAVFAGLGIYGDVRYRLQPIYVDDLAAAVLERITGKADETVDAIGPETIRYRDL